MRSKTTSETGLKYNLSVPCLLILTSNFQTLLSLPGKVLTMSPTGHLSFSKTSSPTCRLGLSTCHFLSGWNVIRYSCLHLLQNVSARLNLFPVLLWVFWRVHNYTQSSWRDFFGEVTTLVCNLLVLVSYQQSDNVVFLGNDEGVFLFPHNISCLCAASTRLHQWWGSASWVDCVWGPLLVRHLISSLKTCCTHLIMVVLAWSRWLLLHLSLLGFGQVYELCCCSGVWLPAGESFKPVRAQLNSSSFVTVSGPTSSKISDCVVSSVSVLVRKAGPENQLVCLRAAAGTGLVPWSAGFCSVLAWCHWTGCLDFPICVTLFDT